MAKVGAAARCDNLLIELGVEELPPTTLQTLASAFAMEIVEGLRKAGLVGETAGEYRYFATPRRLAVWVKGVAAQQPSRIQERRGPSLQSAVDQHGKPSRAAMGFAKSCGVRIAELATLENDKGAWLVYRQKIIGAKLSTIVSECLENSLRRLPIPKRMRWGAGDVEFIRPVHWLVVLHGTEVLKVGALNLRADRMTRGHRFHANAQLPIADADAYSKILESQGQVIADFAQRRNTIQTQIKRLETNPTLWKDTVASTKRDNARSQTHLPTAKMDDELLDLVTGLVEWPQAVLGGFDLKFLQLPHAVLVSAMRDHQKYFHLVDNAGRLLPAFITVSNLACKPNSKAYKRIKRGNERVLRARLADAEFFWNSDLKTPLSARVERLKDVLFHHKLGSLHEKMARVAPLAQFIAARIAEKLTPKQLKGEKLSTVQDASTYAARAAWLCKADLVTDMVGEFPDLQGIIGRHYAEQASEPPLVAHAIEQHYWPRQAGDELPQGVIAQSVAIADRLDSLVGMFASDEIPSGDKDPFALRRAALGVLRILIEQKLELDIVQLLHQSKKIYAESAASVKPNAEVVEQVFAFMLERLKFYYQSHGYRAVELASVIACKPTQPLDFSRRLQALRKFFTEQPIEATALAVANKRIANILKKANYEFGQTERAAPSVPVELPIAQKLTEIGEKVQQHFGKNDCHYDNNHYKVLAELSKLKQPIDDFFANTLVMHEDPEIRNSRLRLLSSFRQLFLKVADISHMPVED